jgi:hypothetical protein
VVAAIESGRRRGDGREALLSGTQLPEDLNLDVRRERCVRAGDQVSEHRNERGVLAGEPYGLGAGRVDDPDAVIGEVRHLDDPRAGTGCEACRDVHAVLFVFVLAGQVDRVSDGRDQGGDLRAETGSQNG